MPEDFKYNKKEPSSNENDNLNLEENEDKDETISVVFENKISILKMIALFFIFIAIILYIFFKVN